MEEENEQPKNRMVKKEESKPVVLVVDKLPTQEYNTFLEAGVNYKLLTTQEAILEILQTVRELKKGLL